jgi:hypothetical protein
MFIGGLLLNRCASTRTGQVGAIVDVTNRNTELLTELGSIGSALRDSNQRATERIAEARNTVGTIRDDSQRAIILFGEYTYIVSDLLRENQQLQREIEQLLAKHNDSGGDTGSQSSNNDSGLHTVREGD